MQSDTIAYFCGDELPASVFTDKYALRDRDENLLETSPDQMHRRIAKELARVEAKKFKQPFSEEYIYSLLKEFGPIIPQGSPMYGIGNPQYISLSNCFVVDPPLDSYGGIMHTDEQLAQICKRRGGVGTDVSHIRPAELPTTNSSRRATGVVTFCERFSNTIREVGQNGRRGALMLTLSVHHPEVVDFAKMKLDPTKVTGANVSIRLTNDFLNAVRNDEEYEQKWPLVGEAKISRKVNARAVWKEIIRCAHERAEPGLLFWDLVISESPADCYKAFGFETVSTNPCSELPLCVLDSCRLLLLNLFMFVTRPFCNDSTFDFRRFYEIAKVAQRLMDNIVDLEAECIDRIIAKIKADPEPEHAKARELSLWERVREKCLNGRRTGTGITALGDSMAAIGIRYGSVQSIEFTDKIYKVLKLACYESSVEMAKELGGFPIWEHNLEKDCAFLNRIKDDSFQFDDGSEISGRKIYEEMQQYGRRNISLLTTAPAGSVSIMAGPSPYFGATSGIEPLFNDAPYTRRKKINHGDKNAKVDYVDDKGDKWTHFPVYHAKLKMWMDITGETDISKSPYHGACANDLDWKQRVKLQAAAQKHVDHAISSTLNLPADVTVEKVAEVYETAWLEGCKGITVYRDGCRDGVLITESSKTNKTDAIKRPKDLPCDIYKTKVKGEDFFAIVGLMDNEPYEVFAGSIDDKFCSSKHGTVRKVKRGAYDLIVNDAAVLSDIADKLTDEQEAVTRLVSTALRHGAGIEYVVHQLEKVKGSMNSFARAIARVLKKYVKDGSKVSGETCETCGEEALVRQEGCATCKSCGASKCS